MEYIIVFAVIGAFLWWLTERLKRASRYDDLKPRLDVLDQRENTFKADVADWEQQKKREAEKWEKYVQDTKTELERISNEKTIGFPWLADAYADYFRLCDLKQAQYL